MSKSIFPFLSVYKDRYKKVLVFILCICLCVETNVNASEFRSPNIDSQVFSSTSIRLNRDIYACTAEYLSVSHIKADFGNSGTRLYNSFLQNIDPLMPIAISCCETGMWADTRYTWSPVVYSKLLVGKDVNMSKLDVRHVNIDTYYVNELDEYLGCGSNCSAPKGSHYHEVGKNDNSSLGPLQILRNYVESDTIISYKCGEATIDLMYWKDNVEYFMHRQAEYFSNGSVWNKDHAITSKYELMALMSVAHSAGSAFILSSRGGSLWHDSSAVYDYCSLLGSDYANEVLQEYINSWYEDVKVKLSEGKAFTMAGSALTSKYDEIYTKLGVVKSKYASGWKHKQNYPLKAVLNFMALEKLYFSGGCIE